MKKFIELDYFNFKTIYFFLKKKKKGKKAIFNKLFALYFKCLPFLIINNWLLMNSTNYYYNKQFILRKKKKTSPKQYMRRKATWFQFEVKNLT